MRAAKVAAMALPARIRWDRVGRVALLLVLLLVVWLYVNPLRSWWSTWHESKARQAEVAALREDNAALRKRRAELRDPRVLEREARERGMVGRDERAYVIEGLPRR
jgi:cell division protein FtsB